MVPAAADYPRNTWYVCAFSSEVTRTPLLREIAGDPIVFYRCEDGSPVGLFGRCPHRGMPLDKGAVVGDRLRCNYHGLEFDNAGRCLFVPSGGDIPSAMAVKQYPLIEVAGWIWVWPGDPAQADPALLPDHQYMGLTAPGYESEPGIYLALQANYLMSLENLADATHITYLHHGLLDTGNVAAHPFRIETDGEVVKVIRIFENERTSEMAQRAFNVPPLVNRTLELTTFAPSAVLVKTVVAAADKPNVPPEETNLIVAVTPRNAKASHQFTANAGTKISKHPERFNEVRDLLTQDVVALNEIQRIYDDLGPERAPEVSVAADAGAFRVRRTIAKMIARERQGGS